MDVGPLDADAGIALVVAREPAISALAAKHLLNEPTRGEHLKLFLVGARRTISNFWRSI